jgi:hypothetical protein
LLVQAEVTRALAVEYLLDAQLARLTLGIGNARLAEACGALWIVRAYVLQTIANLRRARVSGGAGVIIGTGAFHANTGLHTRVGLESRFANALVDDVRAVIVRGASRALAGHTRRCIGRTTIRVV